MKEVWRDIKNYEGIYQISNKNGWKNIKYNRTPFGTISKGYRLVSLGKKVGNKLYHILVAKAFPEICGEWFEGAHVHHINFDKLDNRPENLIVLTPHEHSKLHYKNMPDSFTKPSVSRSNKISKSLKGRKAIEKYIPILQLTIDGKIVREWDSLSLITEELGYSTGNICWACKGKLKTAYGYLWKYKEKEMAAS